MEDYGEGLKRRLKKAGLTLILWFIGVCVLFAVYFGLKYFQVNDDDTYFVAGNMCGFIIFFVVVVVKVTEEGEEK
jgi:hypothetical protein